MAIVQASWADLGFRKLGPLPTSGGGVSADQVAQRMTSFGGYEATPDNWIRHRARRKGATPPTAIAIADVIDRTANLDDSRLSFVDEWLKSEWLSVDVPAFVAEDETLLACTHDASTSDKRWRGLYRLSQALSYVEPRRLKWLFRNHVAPCFFDLYPDGQIAVLTYGTTLDSSAAILRSLYAFSQSPLPELLQSSFRGTRTLQNWHASSLTSLVPLSIEFFNHLFYPFVGGTLAGLPGLAFLFLLQPQERFALEPFPRDWLSFPSSSASFGKEKVDIVEIAGNVHGPAHQRAGHQRYQHVREFGITERLELLQWYVRKTNELLFEMTDVANFPHNQDVQEPVDPIFGFEHQLTVDRLLRKTLLSMSLTEPSTAKLMVFEIADLYDVLSERFKNHQQKTDFFKKLFRSDLAPPMISSALDGLPSPFSDYFKSLTHEVYQRIEKGILDSVWLKSKLTADGILVRNADLTSEAELPNAQFVGEAMRAYRNSHHGYFSADRQSRNRPSRYLYLLDGNLPVEISALPALWWLSYLNDPSIIGWTQLEIGAYD